MMCEPAPSRTSCSLALELSSRAGSIAVGRFDGSAVETEPVRKAARHDDDLVPAIDRLLTRIGGRPGDLREVYVSIGPGGFTGLRIAVTTAKMLAFSVGAKLVAIPTAEIVAESVIPDDLPPADGSAEPVLAVCLAARRDQVWCGTFLPDATGERRWRVDRPGRLIEAGEVADIPGVSAAVVDHAPKTAADDCIRRGLEPTEARFDAAACWKLGRLFARAGRWVDPLDMRPLYAREPEAVRLWTTRGGGTASA